MAGIELQRGAEAKWGGLAQGPAGLMVCIQAGWRGCEKG